MNFLLDTNVISEWVKPRPDAGVMAWLNDVDEDAVFLSVLTLAELRYGIERLAAGNRRTRLDLWLRGELPLRFEGRILSVDAPVANTWGRVMALSKATGRTMSIMDAFLAATAEVHQLILVTRNVADFSVLAASMMNPWSA